ncbi:MucB/RseB C-terminal domain-containing protein [Chitinivorax sp. PXF-14]|uniref:MucB/RseB C-terminal domain-containing protein n=1 Tax=Chitinivorax sp. PXF-14 TaxID=3230488 RepID=UPI0034661E64
MKVWVGFLLLSLAAGGVSAAETILPASEAGATLRRVANAVRKHNYVGTYVYQHDGEVETFRLAHLVDGDDELEKRDSLDGPMREFVRNNDQVNCYLPDTPSNPVELRKRVSIKLFPAVLPEEPSELLNYYQFRKLDAERVAGIDSAVLLMEPKDNLRYGRKLWFDPASGLLLRFSVLNSRREPVEQFSFTQVNVGTQVERKSLKPRFANKVALKPQELAGTDNAKADSGYEIKPLPPGYRMVQEGRRVIGQRNIQVAHLMLSDGLSAMSVFVEPLANAPKSVNMMISHGAINIYTRFTGDSRITAVGDVPEAALLMVGNSVVSKSAKPGAATATQ